MTGQVRRRGGPRRRGGRDGRIALAGLAALCLAVEAAIWAPSWAGSETWSPEAARDRATDLLALRLILLEGGAALWPGQRTGMFATYAFVHAGPVHLLTNMAALLWLGLRMGSRSGGPGDGPGTALTGLTWGAATVAGGMAYAALPATGGAGGLDPALSPMVGASGALFGLIGLWLAERGRTAPWLPLLAVPALLALDAVGWWLRDGVLAWQAHAGGLAAGLAIGGAAAALDGWRGRRRT